MNVQVLTEEANNRLRELEIEADTLYQEIYGYWLLKRSAWLLLTIGTLGLSKIVQIPYSIGRMPAMQHQKAELNRIHFRIADIYYCHVGTHGENTDLIEPEPLMQLETWRELKQKILTDMQLEINIYQEIGAALMAAALDIFRDAVLEIALQITIEVVVMILL